MCSGTQCHIENLSATTAKLAHLNKKGAKWHWRPQEQAAWNELRDKVRNCQLLHHPDPNIPFIVCTDASDYALGACLLQEIDGKEV